MTGEEAHWAGLGPEELEPIKPRFSYDERCEELAEYFLTDENATDLDTRKLAQTIQECIEGWLQERERAKGETQHG